MISEQQPHVSEAQPRLIPRREFIQKSVALSGAAFVGMNALNRTGIPQLNVNKMPSQAATPRVHGNNGVGNGLDPQPPGDPPINDGPGTGPGNPGNQGGANN